MIQFDKILEYLDGKLTPVEQAQLEAEAKNNEAFKEQLELLQHIYASVKQEDVHQFRRQIRKIINEEKNNRQAQEPLTQYNSSFMFCAKERNSICQIEQSMEVGVY